MDEHLKINANVLTSASTPFSFFDVNAAELFDLKEQQWMALGQLASGITHEFNNLLYVMTGYLSLIKSQLAQAKEPIDNGLLMAYLSYVEEAALQAADLSHTILNFSGTQKRAFDTFRLNAFLKHFYEFLSPLLPGPIVLSLVCDLTDTVSIRGDKGLLQQALLNLILNAKSACGEAGNIILSYVPLHLATDYTTQWGIVLCAGQYVKISVKDNGQGILPDMLSELLQPYFTTKLSVDSADNTRHREGTGLGLALVDQCAKWHGGALDCHSVIGEGTCFDLYLPVIK